MRNVVVAFRTQIGLPDFAIPHGQAAIQVFLTGQIRSRDGRIELVDWHVALADLHLDAVEHVRFDVLREPVDPVDCFLQFVRLSVVLRLLQVLGAEGAQQQGQKQVQHLQDGNR